MKKNYWRKSAGGIFTEELRPPQVEFITVTQQNQKVKLEWQPFSGNYFSHYNITVRNYKGGTGYAYQEYPLTTVEIRKSVNEIH